MRNAEFASLFVSGGRKKPNRGSVVVKINKMSPEAGRNFTRTLGTLALGRGLAAVCEMLIRTSKQTSASERAAHPKAACSPAA